MEQQPEAVMMAAVISSRWWPRGAGGLQWLATELATATTDRGQGQASAVARGRRWLVAGSRAGEKLEEEEGE